MNFLFDNNTSPRIARTLDAYLIPLQHRAFHICDDAEHQLGIDRHAKDCEWIAAIAGDDRQWTIATGDRRISKNKAEKEAVRRAQMKGILFTSQLAKLKVNEIASVLLWRWHELEDTLEKFKPPTLIGVPATHKGKLDPLLW